MKKGFTLIELLAVIVILAIIALIATPIVLNIINDSKESATIRSSELYFKATENAIANKMLKDPTFKMEDGTYSIMNDGNICFGTYSDNECTGDILKVESDNQRPDGGFITIKDGQIVSHSIAFGDKIIKSDDIENDVSLLPSIKFNQKYRQISVGPNGETSIWYFEFYEDGSVNYTYTYNNSIVSSSTESIVYNGNLIFITNPDNDELMFLGVISTDGTQFYDGGVYTLEGYDTNENPITTLDSPIKFNKTYLSNDNETQQTSVKFYEDGSADSVMIENGEIVNSSNVPANSFVYSGSVLYSLEGDNYNAIGAITSDGMKIYLFGGTVMYLND